MDTSKRIRTLGFVVDVTKMAAAVKDLLHAPAGVRPLTVAFANVHMAMLHNREAKFRNCISGFNRVFTDGDPLVWCASTAGAGNASRIPGPDFMIELCKAGVPLGRRHYFLGGAPGVAEQAAVRLQERFPGLQIAGFMSPPFRQLSTEEDEQLCSTINATEPDYVWVGLGCPKQEIWIAEHQDLISARALLGVGQAFNLAAGTQRRAPAMLRRAGLEWAYRMACEPRRLAGRYISTNTEFVLCSLWHLFSGRKLATVTAPAEDCK